MQPSERERAVAFLWAIDRAVAGAVDSATVTSAAGEDRGARAWVVSDRRRPLLWDANYLYVEHPGDARAAELAAAATVALQPSGVPCGGVVVASQTEGARLRAAFADVGWREGPLLLMAHRDPARLSPGAGARRLAEAQAAGARRAVILAERWGSEEVADQILGRQALIVRATDGHSYGAEHHGAVASTCVVLHGDGLAQVDDVGTAPPARTNGLARAVVSFATERASEHAALVFLCADALDWPRHLYARLGYEPIGVLHRYFPVLPL